MAWWTGTAPYRRWKTVFCFSDSNVYVVTSTSRERCQENCRGKCAVACDGPACIREQSRYHCQREPIRSVHVIIYRCRLQTLRACPSRAPPSFEPIPCCVHRLMAFLLAPFSDSDLYRAPLASKSQSRGCCKVSSSSPHQHSLLWRVLSIGPSRPRHSVDPDTYTVVHSITDVSSPRPL